MNDEIKKMEDNFNQDKKMSKKMRKHFIVIAMQLIFLGAVFCAIYFVYPRTNLNIHGDFVKLSSINADVIIISDNSEFANPHYIDLREIKNVSFQLNPGKYYWKPYNGFIEGFRHELTINSSVGMIINRTENESDLVNVGNVKINVTKEKNGVMVGDIILEPDNSSKIEDNKEKYIGGQA